MTSHWGRKESVVWPPHSPIYSYGAAFIGLLFIGFFVWCRFTFGQLPLQQFYTPTYLRSAAGAAFEKHDKYALLFAGDGKGVSHLATETEVIAGTTPTTTGKPLPLSLSPVAVASGVRHLPRAAPAGRRRFPAHASILRPQGHHPPQSR